ncbi:MAG TPA: DUF885 family protein, partial [Thermoanaerobaculia bacterium]|nr:DUF885 family protein [Thermoanaerobaculia bacterium]
MEILFLPLTLALLALPAQGANDEPSRLHDLFDRAWELNLKERPTFATGVGRHEYNDRLEDLSPESLKRQVDASRAFLAELGKIDRSKLSADDQVSADIFQRQLEDDVRNYELGGWQM